MKKLLATLTLSLILLSAGAPMVASAQTAAQSECDKLFAATVGGLTDGNEKSVIATRKPLYDIDIEPLGYVYEYNLGGEDGYAIFTWQDDRFNPQEVMPETASPYAETEGKCVYVCGFTYLEYADGEYTDIESGITLLPESIDKMAEIAVLGGGSIMPLSGATVVIPFDSRDKHEYTMAWQTPEYDSSPYLSSCACIGGANLIGFYDRYCVNLIPDYEPGYSFLGSLYIYYLQSEPVDKVIDALYEYMGTTTEHGTTEQQFLDGMTTYCNRAGYTFNYTTLMNGGSLDYSAVINYTENLNKPLALFLSGFNVANISERDSEDGYGYYYEETNHVMAGFGYRYVTYTYNGSTQTYNFIYVSSGISRAPTGYFNTDFNNTKINDVLAIDIH